MGGAHHRLAHVVLVDHIAPGAGLGMQSPDFAAALELQIGRTAGRGVEHEAGSPVLDLIASYGGSGGAVGRPEQEVAQAARFQRHRRLRESRRGPEEGEENEQTGRAGVHA